MFSRWLHGNEFRRLEKHIFFMSDSWPGTVEQGYSVRSSRGPLMDSRQFANIFQFTDGLLFGLTPDMGSEHRNEPTPYR